MANRIRVGRVTGYAGTQYASMILLFRHCGVAALAQIAAAGLVCVFDFRPLPGYFVIGCEVGAVPAGLRVVIADVSARTHAERRQALPPNGRAQKIIAAPFLFFGCEIKRQHKIGYFNAFYLVGL